MIVRNLDPDNDIILTSVVFHAPDGSPVYQYLTETVRIEPWSSISYKTGYAYLGIPRYDKEGGRPFFIVEWESDKKVIAPNIDAAVSFSVPDGTGFKVLSTGKEIGKVIEEKKK